MKVIERIRNIMGGEDSPNSNDFMFLVGQFMKNKEPWFKCTIDPQLNLYENILEDYMMDPLINDLVVWSERGRQDAFIELRRVDREVADLLFMKWAYWYSLVRGGFDL